MTKPVLKLDWCSHEAAKYAVEKWHYSKRMPKSKLAKIGVWEDGRFIGAVIFGVGATSDLVKRYGLRAIEGCELVRVALTAHVSPVSRILAISLKILCKSFPGLRLVVSFADPTEGHHCGIYQAGGWIFAGYSSASDEYIVNGRRYQGRSFRNKYSGCEKHPSVKVVKGSAKIRYLMPLDPEMHAKISPLAQPYPKRTRAGSDTQDTPANHAGEGGSIPTPALQSMGRESNNQGDQ